jgi:predicted ATPase
MTDFKLELKYIWIGAFKALKNFEFNFCHSGEHTFSYDGSEIHFIENPSPPLGFGKNVTSITTIVGKNGSGKSSFCEIVLASVATLQRSSFGANYKFDGIVCYGDTIFIQKNLPVTNTEELKKAGYEIILFNDSPFQELRTQDWADTFVRDGFIYYSNFLDERNDQDEYNLTNISTTWLLQHDWGSPYPIGAVKNDRGDRNKQDPYSQMESYVIQENYRYLRFILEFPEFTPFIGNYRYIALDLTYSGNNKFINRSEYDDTIRILSDFELEILRLIEHSDKNDYKKKILIDQNKFKESRHQFYKLNLLYVIYNTDKPIMDSDSVRAFLYENKIPRFFNESVNQLLDLHLELIESGNYLDEYQASDYEHWFKNTHHYRFYILQRMYIPLHAENREKFKRFMALEEIVLDSEKYSERRISNYQLTPDLSTGESSYLSLFSRIYDTIRKHKKGYDERSKLILFIDEAEVGFHPDWSKQLIKKLLHFLNDPFNPYQIQLILTTHSPYLLSDLPKYNVRRFYKESDGLPQLLPSYVETFGANIYDLLSDNFFMQDGFIGDFAQEKIDACFDLLQNDAELKSQEREYVEKIIDITGEPLIKRQLVQLYDEKFKTKKELDFLDEQIARLIKLKEEREKND